MIVIFFIAVTALVTAPKALQQLHNLKIVAGERVKAELWNAFLSYCAQEIAREGKRRSDQLLPGPQIERLGTKGRDRVKMIRATPNHTDIVHSERSQPEHGPSQGNPQGRS